MNINLNFNVGDQLWFTSGQVGFITSVIVNKGGTWIQCEKYIGNQMYDAKFPIDEIGKTAFLTCHECEQQILTLESA